LIKMFAQKFQEDSENKYELRKIQKYDESWKILPISYLRRRLQEEIAEWYLSKEGTKEEYDELIDIRNFASMLGDRIKRK